MLDLVAKLIQGDEGLRLTVYDDATAQPIGPGSTVKGHPTIGYGRALDTHGVSSPEAAFLFQNDVIRIRNSLDVAYPWFRDLDEPRQAVIVSMVFNVGLAGYRNFAQFNAAIAAHDYGRAAQEMLNSRWSQELPERSKRLSDIMLTGVLK